MLETLQELVNADAALVRRGRWLTADMMVEIGDARHLVKIREGRIEEISPLPLLAMPFDFAICGTEKAWHEFWQPVPKPRHHDVMALIREGKMRIEDDLEKISPSSVYGPGALGWQNGTVYDFLEAAAACARAHIPNGGIAPTRIPGRFV